MTRPKIKILPNLSHLPASLGYMLHRRLLTQLCAWCLMNVRFIGWHYYCYCYSGYLTDRAIIFSKSQTGTSGVRFVAESKIDYFNPRLSRKFQAVCSPSHWPTRDRSSSLIYETYPKFPYLWGSTKGHPANPNPSCCIHFNSQTHTEHLNVKY